MSYRIFYLFILILFSHKSYSQSFTIHGTVKDGETDESLIGCNLFVAEGSIGTVTNNYGFFSLKLPAGNHTLTCSYIGYHQKVVELELSADKKLDLTLTPVIQLEQVDIVANSIANAIRGTDMGVAQISSKQINQLPSMLGESDLMKTYQLMPGVTAGTEATGGMYVRGGNASQNLLLLDGVPVYNANHLFGLFSVFNSDAISTSKLVKGGFPARYGGRLSSVMDIRMKEGNMKKWGGKASVGLISSTICIEGPLAKEKTSFIFSLRKTYIDKMINKVMEGTFNSESYSDGGTAHSFGYSFWDLNFKVNHIISPSSRIYISNYSGNDDAAFYRKSFSNFLDVNKEKTNKIGWGNRITSLRWNLMANDKLFANTTLNYSKYLYTEVFDYKQTRVSNDSLFLGDKYKYALDITDFSLNTEFDFIPNTNHYIKFGGGITKHTFNTGSIHRQLLDSTHVGILDTSFAAGVVKAFESNLFVEDEFTISAFLKANVGIRLASFITEGKPYWSLEPRLNINFIVNPKTSVKLSCSRMNQNMHLLSSAGIGLPTDLWLPSTVEIAPEQSWQYALSFSRNFADAYLLNLEGFYKQMDNLIEYIDGASVMDYTPWHKKVEQGKGEAYGVEAFFEKKSGKLTGWLGYTYSFSDRIFPTVSQGKTFPFKYDQRHDFKIVLMYRFNKHFDANILWVYGSGTTATLPLKQYPVYSYRMASTTTKYMIDYHGHRNNYRKPAYHRLDFGVNYKNNIKGLDFSISAGLYNAYNQMNPYFLYFEKETFKPKSDLVENTLYQMSLFGILPFLKITFEL